MNPNKLSFKKEKVETGLAGVANPWPNTQIKSNKKQCGYIARISDRYTFVKNPNSGKWKIYIKVKVTNLNREQIYASDSDIKCGWKTISWKVVFETENAARIWLRSKWRSINSKFEIMNYD